MSDTPGAGAAARISSLDGLRAISILLVIAHHQMGIAAAPLFIGTMASAIDAGALGVRVFFVISGFLITGILARELQNTGTLSLRTFYLRRTLRIFPAFYVFLLVLGTVAARDGVADQVRFQSPLRSQDGARAMSSRELPNHGA